MNCLTLSLKAFVKRCLSLTRSKDSFISINSAVITVAILGIWLTIVIFTATRHEFWRDEVRPLSLARASTSPIDLYELTQYDGHPILWFLILYIGKSIVDTQFILPIISIVIAFAAVAVLMFLSPFPFWIRCLFIFSALPLYEYSVMARNYGISMLLLFIAALLYRNREKYPLLLGFVLALLANTNVHSAVFVCLIAALWLWDTVAEQRTVPIRVRTLSLYLAFAMVFTGVLLCIDFISPRGNTVLTLTPQSITVRDLTDSLFTAVLRPDQTFSKIVPEVLPPLVAGLLLYLAVFGLLHRPNLFLAALSGQIILGVFFRAVYQGNYRHQGLFLVFMLFLYWLFIQSLNNKPIPRIKHLLFNIGLYVAMTILIFGNVVKAKSTIRTDIRMERSSNRSFSEFLNSSETYRDAIIVPEPDMSLQSLPYYANNRIYFPREHRFGTTLSFISEENSHLSLGELLALARDIKTRYGQSVLIVLGHWDVDRYRPGEVTYSRGFGRYNSVFSWNTGEVDDFDGSTVLVREFNSAYTGENYRVYAIR
jgi:hypothetical protein